SGMPYSVDAIEQFQVVTSGGQAELGRALGGYVNVVTKGGTNEPHGDVYDFVRDDTLNAPNVLIGSTLPMHQNQYGASAGGPMVRDRTFYFANVERRGLTQSGLVIIPHATADAIDAQLAAFRYPGSAVVTGQYPNPIDSTNAIAKVDHQVSAGDQLSVRYSQYGVRSDNSRGAGGLSAATASAGLDNIDRNLAFSNTISLSSRTVNETRAQVVASDLKAAPSDQIGPAVSISGVASFGTLSGSPTRRQNTLYEVVDTLSHQRGTHALRAGVDFLYNDDTITFPRSIRGSYTFSSLANFLSGEYNNAGFSQTFGATSVSQTNPNVGIFAQDEWKLRPELTLNAGLRYDVQFLRTIHTDRNNVAPRAGFAWTPFPERETVVRGSAGLFFDRVPLRALANALLSAGNTSDVAQLQQVGISLSPAQAGAPVFPNVLPAPIASVTLPSLTTMDPNMQNAYSRQAAIEVEQRLAERTTVAVGYQYVRGVDLIISVNQNVPTCVASGTNNGCRPVAVYANNGQYSPLAASSYHGLHVSLVQRAAKWGEYRVSYTLSKAMDNVSEFFFSSPIDPLDLSKDWGRSDDDQRHRLVVNGSINVLTFQLSGTLQYYSALPLNITSGVTTIQGTGGRPLASGAASSSSSPPDAHASVFIPRNSGDGPDFLTLNLRVSRSFHVGPRAQLDGLAEVFNATNRVNAVTINGNFGAGAYPSAPASNFGQITGVGDPRAVQLAVKARF
ncbi:MAG TPA: TonB-dependent receptor, partial [Vicinamibacterales bacterium]|nr:TonB-dependent receptor [Vicinamibacterales bacterium]